MTWTYSCPWKQSTEQYSCEEPVSQVLPRRNPEGHKRKTEEAFSLSPTAKTQSLSQAARPRYSSPTHSRNKEVAHDSTESTEPPLSTSSPAKSEIATSDLLPKPQDEIEMEPPSPMSKVRLLDKNPGAVQKVKTSGNSRPTAGQNDGQHKDASNCGCHNCIMELSITKNEHITSGQELSKNFWELVNKRVIYKNTSMRSHPTPCMCKTHLEKIPSISGPALPKRENPPKKEGQKGVSSLRTHFESGTAQKIDPRTGLPPPDPKNTSKPEQKEIKTNRQNISVITSR